MWHLSTECVWPTLNSEMYCLILFSNSLLCPSPFPLCCHWMTRTTFSCYNILGPYSHQSVCSHSISNPFWWVIYQFCLSWREPNPCLCCFIQLWLRRHSSSFNLLSSRHCNHCTIILKGLHRFCFSWLFHLFFYLPFLFCVCNQTNSSMIEW